MLAEAHCIQDNYLSKNPNFARDKMRNFIILVDENDKLLKVGLSMVKRARDMSNKKTFPQLAGKKVRAVHVSVEKDEVGSERLLQIVYGYMKFDSQGKIDARYTDENKRALVNSFPWNVQFDANGLYVGLAWKTNAEIGEGLRDFRWVPSQALEEAIRWAVFDR
jgi:hypothetical protein